MRLRDKVAVITGATGGFGAAIARLFAAEGASLILNGRRVEAGETLVAALRTGGHQADFVPGDVSDEETAARIAQRAGERHGRIDVLVLNAGSNEAGTRPFWEVSPDEFDAVLRTNVRGVWLGARAAVPLIPDGGSIVVMASQQSVIVCAGNTSYAASKGAALQLARGMALDLAPRGIRVNALCPGICETPLTRGYIDSTGAAAATEAAMRRLSPLGRFGTAAEIAEHTLFLASNQSAFITGAGLIADGGTTIR